MKDLQELVDNIRLSHSRDFTPVGLAKGDTNKTDELFQLIQERQVKSDLEAFKVLYPNKKTKVPNSAYRNVKCALKERLLHSLLLSSLDVDASDRQNAFIKAHKYFAASQLLIAQSAKTAATDFLLKVLQISEQFEFIELAASACRQLSTIFATRIGSYKEYNDYLQKSIGYEQLNTLELKAERYYHELIIHFVNSLSPNKSLRAKAKRYQKELEQEASARSSYKAELYLMLIRLFYHTSVNDYHLVADICDQAVSYFSNKAYEARTPIQIALHHKVVCCMMTGQLDQAKAHLQESHKLLHAGDFNWFRDLEYLLLIALREEDHESAQSIYYKATNHPRFEFLPEQVKEMWTFYQGYLGLLLLAGKLDRRKQRKLRIQHFLNSMPVFSKDKRGLNIGILIVQFCYLVLDKKYNQAIERTEALKRYCSRYLFSEDTFRSYHFIKALLAIPKGNFHQAAVGRHAQKHLEKLKETPSSKTLEHHKLEVLPYERLWAIVFNSLDLQIIKVKK
ncbi:hypothetical protein [Phaeodactylibacter sp.]|uniref:hypothetical protein n=1 Tax=Phaeodactylibacter sp. TaxID=1940289 RepID=UPI0025F2CF5F|nr:hypothetical protein [Phaeodactylibacter sp.]MCI4648421.1 hypothetical protein [Phaeodactylibacter sp.]MCI5093151.1 hypothetical protein [Phaeodactylibacter sp.]